MMSQHFKDRRRRRSLVIADAGGHQVRHTPSPAGRRGDPVFSPIDITDDLLNPTASANIVEFTVPAGTTAEITGMAVVYSEPFLAQTVTIGWRLTVDGRQPVGIRHGSSGVLHQNMGDLTRLMEIEGLYLQGGQVIALQVVPVSGFDECITLSGRLVGKLFNEQGA